MKTDDGKVWAKGEKELVPKFDIIDALEDTFDIDTKLYLIKKMNNPKKNEKFNHNNKFIHDYDIM